MENSARTAAIADTTATPVYDASRARLLQPAAAEPSVAAKSIFGKLLMMLLLVIGEEKRHRLVLRQLLRPLNRQRKGCSYCGGSYWAAHIESCGS